LIVWLFTRNGFISLTQHPQEQESDKLVVQTQTREEMERVVRLLDEIGGPHEIERAYDGFCRFGTVANKEVAAQLIARLVVGIDYGRFVQAVNFDFGANPQYVLLMTPVGLQVARVSPD
jgi:hypothetical protein